MVTLGKKESGLCSAVEGLIWQLGLDLVAIFPGWLHWRGQNKSECKGHPPGPDKVVIVERWPL